ncbi:MAG TPA: histidine--tRNA ligase [Phycisphaerae bacterium]|nr:histidine--tRNA ligase [Phycisphaerae bacterium]
MAIQAVKGTRDLYPEDYAPIQRIFDAWRSVSLRHGFEEFEGPTLEYLELYREKSGDELVGQLFTLSDKGGRELALRPEMTPTLARMVAARINTLAKPIKWFCIPKLFRGENVQRGRLREFFQWNVDVIGTADVIADAECILVGIEGLRELGLTERDFAVHVSNRQLIGSIFSAAGIAADAHAGAYAILDKAGKFDEKELARRWGERYEASISFARLMDLLKVDSLDGLRSAVLQIAENTAELEAAFDETGRLLRILDEFGVGDFCKLNLRIVRGLAYYTGPVFEFLDRAESERAICGGGRYDDLLGKLGKSKEPAVGFGMGDVVLSLMLKDRGLLTGATSIASVFVADAADGLRDSLHPTVAALRRRGLAVEFSYAQQAIGKQLKAADKRGCRYAVILGDETRDRGTVQIKAMQSGESREVVLKDLLDRPEDFLTGQ